MNRAPGLEDKYAEAKRVREEHVDAILNSPAKKKIVVAGPGTGKTYLFKRILEGKTNTLTLTFINSLVEDLSLELCGLCDVRTLHGFARSALGAAMRDVRIFPRLSGVIKEDAKILLKENIDFDSLFHNRDDGNQHIDFYKKRKDYYKHYGFADAVFAIVKYFEEKREKIPTYAQVVVDEFQDFNKLEVCLIDLLAERSPVLLVGDDDQALYDFKNASTEYIRQRRGEPHFGYTPFDLPYCSRCTRVIIETTNDIISRATENGYLTNRINKPYQYFEDKEKDKESDDNAKIIYGKLFAKQIPWFIEQRIGEIAAEVRGKFSVLIISPTNIQCRAIVAALKNKGLQNIEPVEKQGQNESNLLDALKILVEDRKSNLGWRIVSECLLAEEEFESLLRQTSAEGAKGLSDLVGVTLKKEVAEMLKVLRAIKKDKDVDKERLGKLSKRLGFDPHETIKDHLKDEIVSSSHRFCKPSIRKIPIKATTIQSSKGLAAEYVFITHFDDRYFIKDKDKTKISDRDISSFLVALTRAKRKVFLISSTQKEPTFFRWINKGRVEERSTSDSKATTSAPL
jgi:AAA domain